MSTPFLHPVPVAIPNDQPAPLHSRTTTLLDLPIEILDLIADFVQGLDTSDGLGFFERLARGIDAESFCNLRLTCRGLAHVGVLRPPKLIITVAPCDPASVSRLERLAVDPRYAGHIRGIHVRLGFYEKSLVRSPMLLDRFLISRVEALAAAGVLPNTKTLSEWRRAFSRTQITRIWITHHEIPPDASDQWLLQPRLPPEFAEYHRRYYEQQAAAKTVLRRIASAMAKMPHATCLVFDDGPDLSEPPAPGDATLVTATSWATYAQRHGWGSGDSEEVVPLKSIFRLLRATHRAGVKVTALRFHRLEIPGHLPLRSQWVRDTLNEAFQNLRTLEFLPRYNWVTPNAIMPTGYVVVPSSESSSELPSPFHYQLQQQQQQQHQEQQPHDPAITTRLDEALLWMVSASAPARLEAVNLDLCAAHARSDSVFPVSVCHHLRILRLQRGILDFPTFVRLLDEDWLPALAEVRLTSMYLDAAPEWGPPPPNDDYGNPVLRRPIFSWSMLLDKLHCYSKARRARHRHPQLPLEVRIRKPYNAEFDELLRLAEDSRYKKWLVTSRFWPLDRTGWPIAPTGEGIDGVEDFGGRDDEPSEADLYAMARIRGNPLRLCAMKRKWYGGEVVRGGEDG